MSTPTPPPTVNDMMKIFAQKLVASSQTLMNRFVVHQASFQAYKPKNEDRTVAFESDIGSVIAVFDGHCGDELSEYAAKYLPRLLCERIAAKIGDNPNPPSTEITAALILGIQEFDTDLIRAVIDFFPEKDAEDWAKWGGEQVFEIIGIKGDWEFEVARRAVIGSTVLLAFIDKDGRNMWVASLGDSEAAIGRVDATGALNVVRLNEDHNAANPAEVERINSEHPAEPSPVFGGDRLLGYLSVTRALGDHQLKVPLDMALHPLAWVYPSCIHPYLFSQWIERKHNTPPYMSSTCTVQYHQLEKGDVILLASDGFQGANTLWEKFTDEERIRLLVSLASNEKVSSLSHWESRIGHSFAPAIEHENIAVRVIRNVLFGRDTSRMEDELMLNTKVAFDLIRDQRDDMSIVMLTI